MLPSKPSFFFFFFLLLCRRATGQDPFSTDSVATISIPSIPTDSSNPSNDTATSTDSPFSLPPSTTVSAPTPSVTPVSSGNGTHGMCGALVNNIAYIYGGSIDPSDTPTNNLIILDLSKSFSLTSPPYDSSSGPSAGHPALIYQTCSLSGLGNIVITLFGGISSTPNAQALYEYSPSTNAWASPPLPQDTQNLVHHAAATRLTDGVVFLYGGSSQNSTSPLNAMYTVNINNGAFQSIVAGPMALIYHAMVWHPTSGQIVIIGGSSDGTTPVPMTAVLMFNSTANSWATVVASGVSPTPRMRHTAVVTGSNIIVYGGLDGNATALSDFALLDMSGYPSFSPSWYVPLVNGTAPAGRYDHTAMMAGSNMVAFYGLTSSSTVDNSVVVLDTTNWGWESTYTPANLQLTANAYSSPNATTTNQASGSPTLASAFQSTQTLSATSTSNNTSVLDNSVPLPAIIGGSVGGAVAAIGFAVICFWRYRKSQQEIKAQIEFAKELASKPPPPASASRPSSLVAKADKDKSLTSGKMVPHPSGGYTWATNRRPASATQLSSTRPFSLTESLPRPASAQSYANQGHPNQHYAAPVTYAAPVPSLLNPNASRGRGASQNQQLPMYDTSRLQPTLLTAPYGDQSTSSDVTSHPRSPSDGTTNSGFSVDTPKSPPRPLPPTPRGMPRASGMGSAKEQMD